MHVILRCFDSFSFSSCVALQREQELLAEIERLKVLLFTVSQDRDTALEKIEALYLERVAAEDGWRDRENEVNLVYFLCPRSGSTSLRHEWQKIIKHQHAVYHQLLPRDICV